MNCSLHTDTPAVAFCRSCGRPVCGVCQRTVDGTVFCPEHAPATAYAGGAPAGGPGAAANPYAAPTAPLPPVSPIQTSPGLAFLLGLIPGVGAIYNGQYVKGLVHAIVFGLLVSLISAAENTSGQAFLSMTMVAFIFYMPFEAYHTAKKRLYGIPVDEWSGLAMEGRFSGRFPLGPVILIIIGVLFLLDSLHLFNLRDLGRFWPVILIVIGGAMLYSRLTNPDAREARAARRSGLVETTRE